MTSLSVLKHIPKVIRHGGGKLIFAMKKAKPQILVVGGVTIAVGSFVWAVINARKIDETIEEGQKKVEAIENDISKVKEGEEREKSLKELEKDLHKAKTEAVWKMFLLMGLPCLSFAGGMCLTVGGHIILAKRFGKLSTAFAALEEMFMRYRQMNITEHGEECDRRYIYGITGQKEVETRITDENGEEHSVKASLPITDMDGASMYSFIFSEETSRKCPKDPVNTISFLRSQEKYWGIWMETTGKPVTLNMVLEDLGIELDPNDPAKDYVYIAGWRPNGDGDNRIDFGILRAVNKRTLNMEENAVLLNFNCDGNIYHSARYTKDGKKVC